MIQLHPNEFEKVLPLFKPISYELITASVIAGFSPGEVYADHSEQPKGAFLTSSEGVFLAGSSENDKLAAGLSEWIAGGLLPEDPAREPDYRGIYLGFEPPQWESILTGLIPGVPAIRLPRRHYICRDLRFDWRKHLPDGFSVRRITPELLQSPGLRVPANILDWMESNWGTQENFHDRGFGICTLSGSRIGSWSLADCAVDDLCEIGIHTHPEFRRRGLASITTAAIVEHALGIGYREVGWHCHESNTPSWKTAEKVGFEHERDYSMLCWMLDPAVHRAELAGAAA